MQYFKTRVDIINSLTGETINIGASVYARMGSQPSTTGTAYLMPLGEWKNDSTATSGNFYFTAVLNSGWEFVKWICKCDEFSSSSKQEQTIEANPMTSLNKWDVGEVISKPQHASSSNRCELVVELYVTPGPATVTFDPAPGAIVSGSATKIVNPGERYGSTPVAARNGYAFLGWFTSSGVQVTAETLVTIAGDHTLVAHYIASSQARITFNANGGEGAPSTMTITLGEKNRLPKIQPTREGYFFAGWATRADALDPQYFAGKTYVFTNALALKAAWRRATRTESSDSGLVIFAYTYLLTADVIDTISGLPSGVNVLPSANGKFFIAYAEAMNNELFDPDEWLAFVKPIALQYRCGIAGSIDTANIRITATQAHRLVAWPWESGGHAGYHVSRIRLGINLAALDAEGYEFYGWFVGYQPMNGSEIATGSLRYGQIIETNTPPRQEGMGSDKHCVIVPLIRRKRVLVAFDAAGGEVTPTYAELSLGLAYGTLPTPLRSGWTFAGWKNESGASVTAATVVTNAEAHVLVAQWSRQGETITVYFKGRGSVSPASKSVTVGSVYGTLPTPTLTGHVFTGYYTKLVGGSRVTSSTLVTESDDHFLYAQWTPTTLTVTLDPGEGTVSPTTKSVAYGQQVGTLPKPTHPTKHFDGYYTASTGGVRVTPATVITANVTFYARYTDHAPGADWITIEVN